MFDSCACPTFTVLHSLWYRWDTDLLKYVKIVPACISKMFSVISLAHWVMEDGYFDNSDQTIHFCTECYTKTETIQLVELLAQLGIKSGINIRNKKKDTYRIRVSNGSMPLLLKLVRPHIHKDFIYKLGPVK